MDWSKFRKLRILMIDDDQFTRELIVTMLTLHQAKDGLAALFMLETNVYDMFILDFDSIYSFFEQRLFSK